MAVALVLFFTTSQVLAGVCMFYSYFFIFLQYVLINRYLSMGISESLIVARLGFLQSLF